MEIFLTLYHSSIPSRYRVLQCLQLPVNLRANHFNTCRFIYVSGEFDEIATLLAS